MQNLVLAALMAAVFVFGWYLMGKVDKFMYANQCAKVSALTSVKTLRIGFFDPLTADSLAAVLEKYEDKYPDVFVTLSGGTVSELTKEFNARRLDIIFLPANTALPSKIHGRIEEISLEHTPLIMQRGGLRIEPISQGQIRQKLIWADSSLCPEAGRFVRCLSLEVSSQKCPKIANGN